MSVLEFKLDQDGAQRVQVFQDIEGKSLTVLENKSLLGSFTNQEAVETGRMFMLSDGSVLKTQIVNGQIQVQRNSQIRTPVYQSSGITQNERGGCLTTYLVLFLIGAVFTAVSNLLLFFAAKSYVPDPNSGKLYFYAPLWLYVVYALYGISMGVGTIALFRWKRWGYYLIVGNIIVGCLATLLAGPMYGRNLLVVVGLGILTFLLKRNGKWEMFA